MKGFYHNVCNNLFEGILLILCNLYIDFSITMLQFCLITEKAKLVAKQGRKVMGLS